jgi:hypothetical protein
MIFQKVTPPYVINVRRGLWDDTERRSLLTFTLTFGSF